jgi:hypothetical protein
MARRREKAKQAMAAVFKQQTTPKTEDKMADKICGKCKKYAENSWASDGRGTCSVLSIGSDIDTDPAVYVTDGDMPFITMTLTDAKYCKHYDEMTMIDSDNTEVSDPKFKRSIRQMQSK